jgi:hypothetical protein
MRVFAYVADVYKDVDGRHKLSLDRLPNLAAQGVTVTNSNDILYGYGTR